MPCVSPHRALAARRAGWGDLWDDSAARQRDGFGQEPRRRGTGDRNRGEHSSRPELFVLRNGGQGEDAAKWGWSESFYWSLKVIGDWVCYIGTISVPVAIQQVPQVSIWYPVSLADEQIQLASWKIAWEILDSDGFIISKIDPFGFVWKHYPQVHCLVTMFPTTIAPCSDTSWHIQISYCC